MNSHKHVPGDTKSGLTFKPLPDSAHQLLLTAYISSWKVSVWIQKNNIPKAVAVPHPVKMGRAVNRPWVTEDPMNFSGCQSKGGVTVGMAYHKK